MNTTVTAVLAGVAIAAAVVLALFDKISGDAVLGLLVGLVPTAHATASRHKAE